MKSRRVVGDGVVNEIPVTTSRNLRSLIMKGGSGDLTTDWDYFPSKNNNMATCNRLIMHTPAERKKETRQHSHL